LAAGILLGAMLLVMGRSMQDDALTMDEPVHLTAGYTALRFLSARLNPASPTVGWSRRMWPRPSG
jgi:hypothetical protein